jgi:hypothetical protein
MLEKPKYLTALVLLWAILGIMFIILGLLSLNLTIWIFSAEYTDLGLPNWATSMIFFMTFTETTTLLVFGSIFLVFSYETYKVKSWAWNAGLIISTIFLVIFSFLLASLMITTLIFPYNEFTVPALIEIMVIFLVDLGIIFLLTRPAIKIYFEKQKK